MTKKEKRLTPHLFRLLLTFLADGSSDTSDIAKRQIREALERHPEYRALLDDTADPRLRKKVEAFREELRFEPLFAGFERLFSRGDDLDLENGLILLAASEFPDLDRPDLSRRLDALAEGVEAIMATTEPLPTRPISAMRHYLFEREGFRGNDRNYYDPDNTYLNRVVERRIGIPISLSCVYLLVAWRLRLLAHGVGLPGHFIVGQRVPRGVVYVDCFEGGRLLRVKDCEMKVRRLGAPFRHDYLDPVSNLQILSRTIMNLINVYTDRGETARATQLARLFQLAR